MPISAAMTPLAQLIKLALITDLGGSPDTLAQIIAGAVASVSPMGLFPMGMAMIPLVPAGMSGTQAIIKNAFISDMGGSPNTLAQIISSAIAMLCPMVPPTGLSALQALLTPAFQMDMGGSPDSMAQTIASAVVTYFTCGMVI
jgi:hypothetical protein